MPDRKGNAPGLTTEGAPTTINTNGTILQDPAYSGPRTPREARAWEAAAPLNDPAYWLGRSHGYQSGYYDALEDLDNWRRGNSLLKPSVFIELTAEQVHRVGGGGRG